MVEPVFAPLSGEADGASPTVVDSMCVNCGEDGLTRLLLTKIPHYQEVILMSFRCEHCHYTNNEIQPGGRIQDKGVRYSVTIRNERDLCRQVVKSDHATLSVPEIELEIPPSSQKGEVTTVEGVLQRTVAGLEQDQPVRRIMDPDNADKIDTFVGRIHDLVGLNQEFTVIIDDHSGNSFIENPLAPAADPATKVTYYHRTKEQDHDLCLYTEDEVRDTDDPVLKKTEEEKELHDEVLQFPTNCPECNAPCETNMKMTSIPFFKEVVIMATNCDTCGHKTNEVKSGGGIEEKGRRITLRVADPTSDLTRDVLKSETCQVVIPELEFEMGGAALGGRFTTLEGLLANVEEMVETNPLFGGGDAAAPDVEKRMAAFMARLQGLKEGREPFTLVLDDPAGNSYLQNVYAPDDDPQMKIEEYERSFEQNDELGLNDMKVENYEQEQDR